MFEIQNNNLKSLAGSIAHESRNSLAGIKGISEIIRENLGEMNQYFNLIETTANRGMQINDIILKNISDGKIDDSDFTMLSIANVVKFAINEFAFENEDQKKLVNLNLSDDFEFFGSETLMIYVLFNLLKNALHYKVKINICLDSKIKIFILKMKGKGLLLIN